MSGATIFFANLACILVFIAVHECGHFLFGWLGGIPFRRMRIRLLTFPQHVALWDGQGWVSPIDINRYLPIMQQYLGAGGRLFRYVAGGFLIETLFSVSAAVIAKEIGWTFIANMIAWQTLIFYLIYLLLMDLPMALRRGYPFGDTSGLWFISRAGAVGVTLAMLGVRAALIWWVTFR